MEQEQQSDGTLQTRIYISTPVGVVGMYTQKSDGAENRHYFHKDHLGSVSSVSDINASIIEEYSFDPWGKRRGLVGLSRCHS